MKSFAKGEKKTTDIDEKEIKGRLSFISGRQ
jgi:hypothetical protein